MDPQVETALAKERRKRAEAEAALAEEKRKVAVLEAEQRKAADALQALEEQQRKPAQFATCGFTGHLITATRYAFGPCCIRERVRCRRIRGGF